MNKNKETKKTGFGIGITSIWLAIAIICLICIFAGIGSPQIASATILSSFAILPARHYLYKLAIWAISFLASNFDAVEAAIRPWATMETLEDGKEQKNAMFYIVINAATWVIAVLFALFFWIFQGMSTAIVYSFCHSAMVLTNNLATGNTWDRLSVLLWIISTFAWIGCIVWYVSTFLRGIANIKRDAIILGIAFVIKRILNYWFLEYSWTMIANSLLFYAIVASILVICIFVIPKVIKWITTRRRRRRRRRTGTGTGSR